MKNSKFFHSQTSEDEAHAYHTPLEHRVKEFLSPFQEYVKSQATASIFLLLFTLAALVWANIPSISAHYMNLASTHIGLYISHSIYAMPLSFWVNDILLTLFFFFVGLEIKREFLVGELRNHKKAFFIFSAAFGGMLIPAVIYYTLNFSTQYASAWGIPIATDTAFALGILTCFKHKLPKGLFTFLAALAIFDDIGAIIVIAVFYTADFHFSMLLLAFFLLALMALLNYSGFRKPVPYMVLGIAVWAAIESAGVHGTVSGILVAFLIPARPEKGPKQIISRIRTLLNYFEKRKNKTALILEDEQQHAALEEVQEVAQQATTPLQRWENRLELPIALLVLPLFALINAGVPLDSNLLTYVFTHAVSLGILLGLIIGKPLGILLFSKLAIWCKLGTMPEQINFKQLTCVSVLTGIGFTMSLFIANLSFTDSQMLLVAKTTILIGSLFSAILGISLLLCTSKTDL